MSIKHIREILTGSALRGC